MNKSEHPDSVGRVALPPRRFLIASPYPHWHPARIESRETGPLAVLQERVHALRMTWTGMA
jgi:hypothetical protein